MTAGWHACGSSEQVPQVVQTWFGAPSRPPHHMPAPAHLLTKPPHPLASQRCGLGTCTAGCSSGGRTEARCRRWRQGRWPSQNMPPAAWTAGALLHGLLGCLVMGSTGNYRQLWAILGNSMICSQHPYGWPSLAQQYVPLCTPSAQIHQARRDRGDAADGAHQCAQEPTAAQAL